MDRKKRKQFFSNSSKKKNAWNMETGLKGFICTCNGFEKNCVAECYNILNEYYDQLYENNEKVDTADNEGQNVSEDIADEFQKEIDELKVSKLDDKHMRFKVLNTGVTNCIFIKTQIDDPVGLAYRILNDLKMTGQRKTRFLIRMVPVQTVCKANMDDIIQSAEKLIVQHFQTNATTFSVQFTARYNNSIDGMEVKKSLANLVSQQNAEHKVDLKHSNLTIIVEIMKGFCCLSVVPDYFQLSRYNLHMVTGLNDESAPSNSTAKQLGTESNESSNVFAESTNVEVDKSETLDADEKSNFDLNLSINP